MNDDSWTTEIVVPNSPEEVFEAVTNVRGWWHEAIDGPTRGLGDEFTFDDGDLRSLFRITELTPGRRVVWQVLDSQLNFVEDHDEWTGTHVSFDITPAPDGTRLRFVHHGLRPDVECYQECSRGWDFYLNQSIKELLTAGAGQPIRKP